MKQVTTHEPELLLPPWPQRRRRLAAVVMISFILLASGLIGMGVYQVGISMGKITPPLNKERLTQSLLADTSFIKAVKQAGEWHECINSTAHFRIMFEAPFRPLNTSGTEACLAFVALHPTGADVMVTLEPENSSRNQLSSSLPEKFSSVQADLISGNGYETTRLSGVRGGILTTIYIVKVEDKKSWIISYSPTSPTLDLAVQGMVERFQAL